MASKHTPGPWVIEYEDTTPKIFPESGCFEIAVVSGETDEEIEANARLMAAAPELFAALKFCISVMESNGVFETSERLAIEEANAVFAKINPR